jgi:hypothetical protein
MPRPLGSTNKPKLADNINNEERAKLVQKAIEKAEAGDVIMLKFLLEQVYGKAEQPVSGFDGSTIYVKFDKPFEVTPKPKGDNPVASQI